MSRVIEVERPQPELAYKQIPHFQRWAELIEGHRFVALIAFRKAMKSVMLRAYIAYCLYNHRVGIFDGYYYSASERLARKHIERLKLYIEPLALKWGWVDTTEGRAFIRYEKAGALFIVEPEGVDSRQRGARADLLCIDDCIDPQKALSYADIDRTVEAISRRLLPILKNSTSRVLFVGTPICDGDVVDWIRKNESFKVDWLPIIGSDGLPVWPQRFGFGEIEAERKLVGPKAFQAEYMLMSIAPLDTYLSSELIDSATAKI